MAETESDSGSEQKMPRIVNTEGVLGGDPRIEGHRIGVYHVYKRYTDEGESAERIADSYDISVSEVHAALSYAFDNIQEMQDIERRNRELYEQRSSDRAVPDADN